MALLRTTLSDRPRLPPSQPPGGRRRLGATISLLLALLATFAPAQGQVSREYQVKAVFLFNFAQFVDWPSKSFASPDEPLVIGVLGHDPFGANLDEAVRGETVHNRPLRVERYQRLEDVRNCHVLYVSRSEAGRLPQILTALRGREILAVSDIDEFAARGGTIQFVTDRNKVRLRINIDAARAAALTISSKLLRPAEIVATRS